MSLCGAVASDNREVLPVETGAFQRFDHDSRLGVRFIDHIRSALKAQLLRSVTTQSSVPCRTLHSRQWESISRGSPPKNLQPPCQQGPPLAILALRVAKRSAMRFPRSDSKPLVHVAMGSAARWSGKLQCLNSLLAVLKGRDWSAGRRVGPS